mmetsp:Transcript_88227/g.248349  ORF Transcript_88227/g.248349 Transcript_88227/m.248349 type:complete len:228 (-) Transcript_88227:133-816(-)
MAAAAKLARAARPTKALVATRGATDFVWRSELTRFSCPSAPGVHAWARPTTISISSRGYASTSGNASGSSDGASSGSGDSGGKKSESDKRFDDSGEYDTQENYKRVGNPISWANPTGGGTVEDNSSKHWRWVYPAGVAGILLLCLWSRRRNLRKEQEAELTAAMPDLSQMQMPAYEPPPPPPPPSASSSPTSPDALGGRYEDDTLSQHLGGSGGFSAPPPSTPRSSW